MDSLHKNTFSFFLLRHCYNTWSSVVLLLTSSVLPLAAGVPLTLHNVTTTIKSVEWNVLCECLHVPESKRRHIEQQAPEHQRRMLGEWWLLTDPAPSWRRLISCLDYYGDSGSVMNYDPSCAATADLIRHNAEPVQGMLSTFMSLFICMQSHVMYMYMSAVSSNLRELSLLSSK